MNEAQNNRIIEHYRDERWAVEFIHTNGGCYRTQFTSWSFEAHGWLAIVNESGWPISGNPYRSATRWENEDFVVAYAAVRRAKP